MKTNLLHSRRRRLAGFATLLALAPLGAHAQSGVPSAVETFVAGLTGEATTSLDGWLAFGAVVIGAILAILYFRGMYLVLHYASKTYDLSLNEVDDAEYSSKGERRLLYVGSIALVALSGLVISAYGFGPLFLYIGPALTLLGPIVIIVSFEVDIRKYRRVLGEQKERDRAVSLTRVQSLGQQSA